jgi:hypothetical protein
MGIPDVGTTMKSARTNRVWIAPEAIAAMDRFAATLGRRVGQTRA